MSLTVDMRWAIITVVKLLDFIRFARASWTTCSLVASSAEVASSKTRSFGLLMRARAMATLCFWPPLSRAPPGPTSVSYPNGSSEMKPWAFACFAASTTSSLVQSPL
mmetsp:Transcript_8844/g.26703  ORF Transcript_8844/g.26703 Transcript_8844/m.26703 type:complete len:107 (-) Transcript_8844:157-477(-)